MPCSEERGQLLGASGPGRRSMSEAVRSDARSVLLGLWGDSEQNRDAATDAVAALAAAGLLADPAATDTRPYCLRCEVPIYTDEEGVWRREATGVAECPRNPAKDGHEPRTDPAATDTTTALIAIPRPRILTGPQHMSVDEATAMYLTDAAIRVREQRYWGSGATALVSDLLDNAARAVLDAAEPGAQS